MRDSSDQMHFGQNSRAKFKQRIAGGAVLLIVLAIFLPFIFNHSRTDANNDTPLSSRHSDATEQAVNQPVQTVQTPDAAAPAAVDTAAVAAIASAVPAGQQNPAVTSDPSMRSDEPGLTPPQSESTAPDATQPAPEMNMQAAASAQVAPSAQLTQPIQQSDPVNPVAAVEPEQTAVSAQSLPTTAPMQATAQPSAAKSAAAIPTKPMTDRYPAAVSAPAWIVQVGSFAQPERAQRLVAKLRAHGLPAYTQRGAHHFTRVYVGPLTSQHQAQKVQQQVQHQFHLNALVREKP